jgi:hypothetical protein
MERSIHDTYVSKKFVKGLCAGAVLISVIGSGIIGSVELACRSMRGRQANIQLLSEGKVLREYSNASCVREVGKTLQFNCDGDNFEWNGKYIVEYLGQACSPPKTRWHDPSTLCRMRSMEDITKAIKEKTGQENR